MEMKNNRKYLLIGSLIFIGLCFTAIKTDLVQIVHAKVDDAMTETTTIRYNLDNRNIDARAVVSPDRTHLAFCTGTKEFFIQEISTGTIITYPTEENIRQLKYSPNGVYVAAGRNVLNTKTGKVMQLATDAKMPSTSDYIAFSSDSEKLALVNEEQVQYPRPTCIEIWNVETEQLVQKIPSNDLTNQMTFTQDGRFLASTGREIMLWDLQEGRCVNKLVTDSMPADNELKLHTHYEAITCSPDGKYLAAVLRSTYHNSKKYDPNQPKQTEVIEIWDVEQGVVVKTLVWNNQETIKELQYSSDGQYLASGKIVSSLDDMMRDAVWIWDVNQGQVVKKLTQFPKDSFLIGMDYSADGNYLSASGTYYTKIWKIK